MSQLKLGVCFYPTTIGLIDDNEEYLKHLVSYLDKTEKFPCFTYDDPQKALHFLTNQYQSDAFINRCLISQESEEFDHFIAELNIRAIHQEIYNSYRFNEITVLVIDYAMPRVNGLDICRQLRDTSVKTIMLTGEASKDFAVEAFNEGSIDRFILKKTPNLLDVLAQTVRELQENYFLDLSKAALNKIANFSKGTLLCLENTGFVEFFKQLCKTNRIVEYYLLDNQGSFLLLDAKGKASWLAVANEELMLTYANLAKDDTAPIAIINGLKNKQMIPYFYTDKDFAVRPAEWQRYLHPAHKLPGEEIYYTYIAHSEVYEIDYTKVVSYQQFLNTRS